MKKNNTIEFLKDYYSEDIIAQACAYCDELYSDKYDEGDIIYTYIKGFQHGKLNPNRNITPQLTCDYIKNKDFAFIFDFRDNDFGLYMERAAEKFCQKYNEILSNIELYTKLENSIENLQYSSVQSYIEDLENMEKIDNIIELMKALFIGEYMSDSADRFWGKKPFLYSDKLKQAMHYVDYLDFDEQVHEYEEDCSNGETITYKKYRWLIGKIDEISKVCEEQYKGQQDDYTRKFEDYWLNGEVLIVKMVNGRLTAKVR
jgi:ribosome assembly protein YihI (activator of Der GTPase)